MPLKDLYVCDCPDENSHFTDCPYLDPAVHLTLVRPDPVEADMPEPLPNTGATASDGGPELIENSEHGEKQR